jgi:hypothetical protein
MSNEIPVNPRMLITKVRQKGSPSWYAFNPIMKATSRIIELNMAMVEADIELIKNCNK